MFKLYTKTTFQVRCFLICHFEIFCVTQQLRYSRFLKIETNTIEAKLK